MALIAHAPPRGGPWRCRLAAEFILTSSSHADEAIIQAADRRGNGY